MKRGLFILSLLLALVLGIFVDKFFLPRKSEIPIIQRVIDRSLDRYSIDNLRNFQFTKSLAKPDPASQGNFQVIKILDKNKDYTSNEFTLEFNPNLDGKTLKKTSGMINIPKGAGTYPIVIMIRGYIDPKEYSIGEGTKHAAFVFAQNGFITVAPDFLGYGESDQEAYNTFEARFQTYTTILSLLKSVDHIAAWDHKNIFIWAHSNGGQIALNALEITGKAYPVTLWAPVSTPFPYSILYYTDEGDDKGKALRQELARFEEIYNVDNYSLDNYFDRIAKDTVIQLHQGTDDDAVPIKWSDNLNKKLKELGIKTNYFIYPRVDHNMMPSWNLVVQRDITFFKENIK